MILQNKLLKRGKILSPWLGDIVDYGIGLSYRHARLHRLAAGTTTLCQSQLYPPPLRQGLRIQQLCPPRQRLRIRLLSFLFVPITSTCTSISRLRSKKRRLNTYTVHLLKTTTKNRLDEAQSRIRRKLEATAGNLLFYFLLYNQKANLYLMFIKIMHW